LNRFDAEAAVPWGGIMTIIAEIREDDKEGSAGGEQKEAPGKS